MAYAELHCLTNFSFLRGASHPEELVARAVELGYAALAVTDECSVAGVVRAHVAACEHGLKLIVGSEFHLEDGLRCVLLATDRSGYGQLCRLITRARRAAGKGSYRLRRSDFDAQKGGNDQGVGGSVRKRRAGNVGSVFHYPLPPDHYLLLPSQLTARPHVPTTTSEISTQVGM